MLDKRHYETDLIEVRVNLTSDVYFALERRASACGLPAVGFLELLIIRLSDTARQRQIKKLSRALATAAIGGPPPTKGAGR